MTEDSPTWLRGWLPLADITRLGISHARIPHPIPREEIHAGLYVKCPLLLSDFLNSNLSKNVVKLPNINFYENPFSGYRVVTCGQTDTTNLRGSNLATFGNF
jgi:hypothetical protein